MKHFIKEQLNTNIFSLEIILFFTKINKIMILRLKLKIEILK